MPRNQLCQQIAAIVKALRDTCPRRIVDDDGRRVRERLEDYHARVLIPALERQFPRVKPHARETVGLMAYLGPPGDGCVPKPLRRECLALARQYTGTLPEAEQREKLVQVVLAYGCRWQRSVHSGVGRWNEHWPEAVRELTDIAYNFVVAAIKRLQTLPAHGFVAPKKSTQQEYAGYIAGIFTGQRPELGRPKYTYYQSIHTWEPDKGRLYGWLQHAIQGFQGQLEWLQHAVQDVEERRMQFPTNMFTSGLLFPLLRQDELLDAGPIAFRHCRVPDCNSPKTEYHRDNCPGCDTPYTPAACRFSASDRLFGYGHHVNHPFVHCINHKDENEPKKVDKKTAVFYDVHLRACPCPEPDCHQELSQTPTHLFVPREWNG